MCGIWALLNLVNKSLDKKMLSDFWNLKDRGPDNSTFITFPRVSVGFHRLSIMDTSFNSNQPYLIEQKDKTIIFLCNGEVYNFKYLIEKYNLNIKNNSDCLTIPELYLKFYHNKEKFIELFKSEIKSEFAFILIEFDHLKSLRHVFIGRDTIGIRPLYYNKPNQKSTELIVSSEVKGTLNFNKEIIEFPPGNILELQLDELSGIKPIYHNFSDWLYIDKPIDKLPTDQEFLTNIRDSVINSVRRRLDADRPIAFLLSGGIDSSLVCAIAQKIIGHPIKTFCCGMEGGSDLKYAKQVAEHIGSFHTEVIFTEQEALDAIEDVIYKIESWDTTSIRASVGQYIISKYISQNTDCKVVLVGEGPDEVCSSYLFNWYAPDDDSSISDTAKEYVKNIHLYDCKRSDRCISNWGLEGRVPLLDPEFIEQYWKLPSKFRHPKYKNMEKWWLREAFKDLLPEEVIWRKKEAFSDGISSIKKSWFEIIQAKCEKLYSDNVFENLISQYPDNERPTTKESLYFKEIFIKLFTKKNINIIPKYWLPKWNQNGLVSNYVDPSARKLIKGI